MADFNSQIIQEFRANGGKVGGDFEGAPLLLLTTIGAKSNLARTTPLVYLPDGDRIVIFASKAGADTNPDWFHNLVAHPTATVEVGADSFAVEAEVLKGAERDALFAQQAEVMPGFKEYEGKTSRVIPVVALTRKP
ncbi:MAG: nitroreductase family deazaflavin-dependent oxidoreductase [Actinomycetia bacterium]|nr:nitroreductase family deazaflavin-dependent oxidoreductase [Actinomycetes bacterium]